MKTIRGMLITIAILSMMTGCAQNAAGSSASHADLNHFLVTKSAGQTEYLGELASVADYTGFFTHDEQIIEIINAIGTGNYSMPNKGIVITFSDKVLEAIFFNMMETQNIDEKVYRHLCNQFGTMVASMINGFSGTKQLAATSILNTTDAYRAPEGLTQNTAVILDYGNGTLSSTYFRPASEGTVIANTTFILTDIEIYDALSEAFGELLPDIVLDATQFSGQEIENFLNLN